MVHDYGLTLKQDFLWKGGSVYNGYVDSLQHPMGWGVIDWKDGTRYEGEWFSGQASGKGKLFLPNGDTYEGEWKND